MPTYTTNDNCIGTSNLWISGGNSKSVSRRAPPDNPTNLEHFVKFNGKLRAILEDLIQNRTYILPTLTYNSSWHKENSLTIKPPPHHGEDSQACLP